MRMMSLGERRPVPAAAGLSARSAQGKRGGFPIKPRSRHRGPATDKGWPTLLARCEKAGTGFSQKARAIKEMSSARRFDGIVEG
jgi:hypothetical protein